MSDTTREALEAIERAVMSLPLRRTEQGAPMGYSPAYLAGHRDARHDAAELVAAAAGAISRGLLADPEFSTLMAAPAAPEPQPVAMVDAPSDERRVWIDYTNWKGERAVRMVRPCELWFARTEYHPEQQWLMRAWDAEKKAIRDFALKDVHSWTANQPVPVAWPFAEPGAAG